MALKSWSIANSNFTGATPEAKVEQDLLVADATTIILLSLIISNQSGSVDAAVKVSRVATNDVVKFSWNLFLPKGHSPFALDSKMVFVDGDKLVIESDNPDVSVDASGDES